MKAEVDFQLKKTPYITQNVAITSATQKSLLKAFLYSEINIQVKYLSS